MAWVDKSPLMEESIIGIKKKKEWGLSKGERMNIILVLVQSKYIILKTIKNKLIQTKEIFINVFWEAEI